MCPVCLGLPGALPVLNRRAVDLAMRAALALGCRINAALEFARKNYFYPDLPKGYQISQYERPLATGGGVDVTVRRRAACASASRASTWKRTRASRCTRAFADSDRTTYVDFNRSGVPLIEIVTEPDLRSAADAAEFFEPAARRSSCGSASTTATWKRAACAATPTSRCGRAGATTLGTKAEVKNLNSFRYLQKALEYEIERQIDVLERGGRVVQETRLWDAAAGARVSMRSKEEAHDYRYFPEPDLPPLVVDAARIDGDRARRCRSCPTRAAGGSSRSTRCPSTTPAQLTQSRGARRLLRGDRRGAGATPKAASNWIMGELRAAEGARRRHRRSRRVTPAALAGLIALVDAGHDQQLDRQGRVREDVRHRAARPTRSSRAEGLAQIDDEAALVDDRRATCWRRSADAVAQYRAGKTATLRLPRRPGDEGGGREGEPQAGERAAATGNRRHVFVAGSEACYVKHA